MSSAEDKHQARGTPGKARCTTKHLLAWGRIAPGASVVQVDTGAHVQMWRSNGKDTWELESSTPTEEAKRGDE